MRPSADPAPIAWDLTKYYSHVLGVEGIDLLVEPGTLTGLLGPNGAGKTTLLRLLVGLLRPTRGEARFFDVPTTEPQARGSLGYMPADPAFYLPLSVGSANRCQHTRGTDRLTAGIDPEEPSTP